MLEAPKPSSIDNGSSYTPEINVHCRKRHNAEKGSYNIGHKPDVRCPEEVALEIERH